MVLSMLLRLVLANPLFSLQDINLTLGLSPPQNCHSDNLPPSGKKAQCIASVIASGTVGGSLGPFDRDKPRRAVLFAFALFLVFAAF